MIDGSSVDEIVDHLRAIDSATKYPSIPTYHELGDRGKLQQPHIDFDGHRTHLTEKIDGTSFRIILLGPTSGMRNFLIGSRNELLHFGGDVVHNPSLGIVDGVLHVADKLADRHAVTPGHITVVYGELYGGKINKAAKQYSNGTIVGMRFFDVFDVDCSILEKDIADIASWREHGGQCYYNLAAIKLFCERYGLERVPDVAVVDSLPDSVEDTLEFLRSTIKESSATLHEDAGGRPEGLVARSDHRTIIAKLRFEDYERSLAVTWTESMSAL